MGHLRTSVSIRHGKPVVMREYTNWRYHVAIAADGAIQVRPGDWLSKYSAAIHNDYLHINEYARISPRSGVLEPIQNVNLILAGETIYHMPTRNDLLAKTRPPVPADPKSVRREEILRLLKASRVAMPGENVIGDYLNAAEVIGNSVEVVAMFVELYTGTAALSSGAAAAVSGPGVIVISAVSNALDFWRDLHVDYQLYGLVAQCYAATAWGYKHPVPTACRLLLNRAEAEARSLKNAQGAVRGLGGVGFRVDKKNKTWNQVTDATVKKLEETAVLRGPHTSGPLDATESLRALIRAVGKNDPVATCRGLMNEVQHTRSYAFVFQWESVVLRRVWDSYLQEIRYPD